jgi:cbb3-type cytochrome oxidase subunit 3
MVVVLAGVILYAFLKARKDCVDQQASSLDRTTVPAS